MHGLLGALLNFAILVVLCIVNMNLLAEWWVGTLAMGIFVVVMCTGSVATRKERGGNMTFGQAYGASMVMWALVGLIVAAVTKRVPKSEFS